MEYIKYAINTPAFPKNVCDIYHQRYHVCFFHLHFHVYMYNTEHLNISVSQEMPSSEAKDERSNTDTVLLGHMKHI